MTGLINHKTLLVDGPAHALVATGEMLLGRDLVEMYLDGLNPNSCETTGHSLGLIARPQKNARHSRAVTTPAPLERLGECQILLLN